LTDADPDETITNDEQDYDEISASNFLKEVFRDIHERRVDGVV
jgi:hypothetical protein